MINFQVALFFILISIATTNNVLITSDFKNVFHRINDKILETVDDVFILLKINENFTKSKNVAESLLLNDFIQNVSENYNKKYEEIYNLSKTTTGDNKRAYFIFIINEMIEELLMRERDKLKLRIGAKYYKNTFTDKNKNESQLLAENQNTINLVNFKNDFNSKVERWIIKDVVYKLLFANPKKSLKRQEVPDLEFWEFNTTNNLHTRRIFNAQATSVEEFPFMASVHIQGQFSCAGSIIRKDFVITAASCLRPFHIAQRIPHLALDVRVGSDFTSKDGELIPVTEMYFYPFFNHDSLSNNLAMLKLKKRLQFNKNTRKILFDANAYKMPENAEDILILGWGSINVKEENQVYLKPLSYAFVEVYNLQECKNIYSSFYVKERNFCTGYVSRGSGACKNDVGGPAVVGSTLTGIISYGSPRCGKPDAPTVYTKLGYYAAWINSVFERVHEVEIDFKEKSRYVLQPKNIMSDSEFAESANNITIELETLAELIGELQVAEHINSSLTEILREKQLEEINMNFPTNKDDQSSAEKENVDVINANLHYLQNSMSDESVSTSVNATIMPDFIKNSDASKDKNAQKDESAIFYSKESEETTTHKSIYIDTDNHFADQDPSKPYSQTSIKLTTNADVDQYTIDEEWPSTRLGNEILSEINTSNVNSEYEDIADSNNDSENDSAVMIKRISKSADSDTSQVLNKAEQDEGEIVFQKRLPAKRLSIIETKKMKLLQDDSKVSSDSS